MKNTQKIAILKLLKENKRRWVELPRILRLGIAQYNARIFDLREDGWYIENKKQYRCGAWHSWYMLTGRARICR